MGGDGQVLDAVHAFQFMGGRLATMLWEDGMRVNGGGDESGLSADVIIPDGHPGSGSSVPGGPGVRATEKANGDGSSSTQQNKPTNKGKGGKGGDPKREKLFQETSDTLRSMRALAEREAKQLEAESIENKERSESAKMEDLIDDVVRLQNKFNTAPNARTKSWYGRLLAAANARLDKAEAGMASGQVAASTPDGPGTLSSGSVATTEAATAGVGGSTGDGQVLRI